MLLFVDNSDLTAEGHQVLDADHGKMSAGQVSMQGLFTLSFFCLFLWSAGLVNFVSVSSKHIMLFTVYVVQYVGFISKYFRNFDSDSDFVSPIIICVYD